MAADSQGSFGIHWFRRDLRVAGNPALQWSWKEHSGRVVGLFCFDPKFLARSDFSPNRFAFFLQTLLELQTELRSVGSDLLILDHGPAKAFPFLFEKLAEKGSRPSTVSFNRDYEPFARERDSAISELLTAQFGSKLHTERDHLLIEPHEITKDSAGLETYQIYSPFAKRWFEKLKTPEVIARIEVQKKGLQYLRDRDSGKIKQDLFQLNWTQLLGKESATLDQLEPYLLQNSKLASVPIPKAGSLAALRKLKEFKRLALERYAEARDFPNVKGTSQLSIFLKNGSLTAAQIIAELDLQTKTFADKSGPSVYLKGLAWREFYYYIL
ncbi:MAG: deoxyribodipyrimidine photo-lyase, partial [Deltaproteobacteria bacterium]|nr:deoxyribodipyrimidine photo-lyase [Deltaproteobacteria bacterium]